MLNSPEHFISCIENFDTKWTNLAKMAQTEAWKQEPRLPERIWSAIKPQEGESAAFSNQIDKLDVRNKCKWGYAESSQLLVRARNSSPSAKVWDFSV